MLYQEWRSLANSPLEDPDWLMSWWSVFGADNPDRQLRLLELRGDDGLAGIAPLFHEKGRLRLLGSGLVCTDHQELVIARPNRRPAMTSLVFDSLFDSPRADDWRVLNLECIDWGNTIHAELVKREESGGVQLFMMDDQPNCSVALANTWDTYLATVSKNHRKRCRRLYKRYFESGLAEELSTEDSWDTNDAFQVLQSLHNKRRRDVSGRGRFEDEQFKRFHDLAFRRLASEGKARIRGLRIDGQIVATEYELLSQKTVYGYQSGMDPDAMEHSPGTLSIMSGIRNAIQRGQSEFDLMRGAEPYKSHWHAVTRRTVRAKVWHDRISGSLARSSNVLWAGSKELWRSFVR